MKRTRLVFFVVLAACLLILAASLARHILSPTALLPIFVGCAVFGVGVVVLDFLGVLGHHVDDALAGLGGHTLAGGADGAAAGIGHDLAGHDFGAGHDAGAAHGGDGGQGGAHVAGASAHAGHAQPAETGQAGPHQSAAAAGRPNGAATAQSAASATAGHLPGQGVTVTHAGPNATPVLSLLAYLRLLVYFCLGFGPAGWVALAGGESPLVSLGIAVPFGLASLFLARAFFRFQRRDTGAVPPEADLLREQAEVLVPLDHATMGKVRVRAGMTVSDLYALAADPDAAFKAGDTVCVVRVSDECVYVR